MAINMNEVGSTGLSHWAGRVQERYLANLQGPAGIQKFATMLRKEPACFTADWLVRNTAAQSVWNVVPASNSAQDRAAAEFVEQCMGDMSHSLAVAVDDAMTAQWFGFSILEIVWKRRQGRSQTNRASSAYDDGLIGVRKLAIRRQETIASWIFDDNGGVQGVVQTDSEYKEREIPIEKLLHFVVIHDRANPEGLALAEVAYKSWHMLENFEIIDGIGAERSHVGLPVFTWQSPPNETDRAAIEALGQGLVVNEQAYVALPGPLVKFDLVSITNTNADALRARINQLRWELTGLVFGNYIRLGTTDTGNRALSETLADAFTKGVDAVLENIAEVFNQHLIPRLFAYNPSFTVEQYPRMQPSKVHKLPLFVLQYLDGVQNWLLAAPDEDNLWLREILGMPNVVLRPEPPELVAPPEPEDTTEDDEPAEDTPEDDAEDADEGESDADMMERTAAEFAKAASYFEKLVTANGTT